MNLQVEPHKYDWLDRKWRVHSRQCSMFEDLSLCGGSMSPQNPMALDREVMFLLG